MAKKLTKNLKTQTRHSDHRHQNAGNGRNNFTQTPETGKISIQSLVLSCFDEFELVREAMKYGAHDYIRKLSIDPAKLLEVLKEMKEAISDQPEKNASFSLNTDDLKYLFIKRLQNQGFEDHEQVKNVLHNIKLDISIQDYHLIRFSFEPDTAPITDTNRKNMIYNLLNQICERYSGQELFSLMKKDTFLYPTQRKIFSSAARSELP